MTGRQWLVFGVAIGVFVTGVWYANRELGLSVVHAQSVSTDWPMVGHDPAHTGKADETLGTNFSVAWTRAFAPEKLYPQVQAIVYTGSDNSRRVYIGTEMGNVYALGATNGNQSWKYTVGGAILSSVAAANNRVFVTSLDGYVYALDAVNGSLVWKKQISTYKGISASPVISDNKVIVSGRNGVLYALDPTNGNVIWQFDAGAPLLQTPAVANGRVYVGANNMYFYSVDVASGNQIWKSGRMDKTMALKDYWPVVYGGYVFVRGISYGEEKNFYAFSESTGVDAGSGMTQYTGQTMNGATAPPCVDGGGKLVVPTQVGGYPGGWARMTVPGWGLTTISNSSDNGGSGNPDENLAVSCSNNLIFIMHFMEQNANYTGAYNLNTNSWTNKIEPGAIKNEMGTNTQGGGTNPASISNGYFYHTMFHELIARRAQ